MNAERNTYNNVVYLEHLKATHKKTDDTSVECPLQTCIIKVSMREKDKKEKINSVMYNRLLDECGDADILNSKRSFVDPALKFFHKIPLMMNTFMPTGGVISPSSTTITTIIPNQTGSMPNCCITGKKIGIVSRIIARESKAHPITK